MMKPERLSVSLIARKQTNAIRPATLVRSLLAAGLVSAGILGISSITYANPTGGIVSSGGAAINASGGVTTITQSSSKAAINWNSFNIDPGETVRFVQPSAQSVTLNRVTGSGSSTINGSLLANGQVFLLNPNGVLFGANASVNTAGLLASTLSLSDSDFMAGHYQFSGTAGSVVNQGSITATAGGYIALLGGQVSNQGYLSAKLGSITLASGSAISLSFNTDGLPSIAVTQGTLNALAENRQLIYAPGGTVLLTAMAADSLVQAVVNNSGTIDAHTIDNHNGTIRLLADMNNSVTQVGGVLDASAPDSGNGGYIDTSGAAVKIDDAAQISTRAPYGVAGNWLIDPGDFYVQAANGNISGATLSAQLQNGNVEIKTAAGSSADIHIFDPISWNANTILTITYDHWLDIILPVTATGQYAGLVMTVPGVLAIKAPVTLSGANATLTINNVSYHLIHDMADFALIGSNPGWAYAIAQNIEAGSYAGSVVSTQFTGVLDGLGHTINDLTINRATNTTTTGLFASTNIFSTIRNLGLTNVNISAGNEVGALSGHADGTFQNVYATGSVSGVKNVGGLFGNLNFSYVQNAYSSVNVTATGQYAGGMAGSNTGTILESYATGNVTGTTYVGGLVGNNANNNGGYLTDVYTTGNVSGTSYVGGIVGNNLNGTVTRAYETGHVAGTSKTGAVVGYNGGTIIGGLWNTDTAGLAVGIGTDFTGTGGTTGATTAALKNMATYVAAGWSNIKDQGATGTSWRIFEGYTTPLLRSFLKPDYLTATSWTYDGTTTSSSTYTAATTGAALYGSGLTATTNSVNAGTYTTAAGTLSYASGLYSDQQGYDISFTDSLTIGKASLTLSSGATSKTYDGTLAATGTPVVVGGTLYRTDSISGGTYQYTDTHTGTDKSVTVSGVTINDGNNGGNYNVTYLVDQQGTITPAPLTIQANDATQLVTLAAYQGGNGVSYTGLAATDSASSLTGTLAYGGSAQAARLAGRYSLVAYGLSSNDYNITYLPGVLTLIDSSNGLSGYPSVVNSIIGASPVSSQSKNSSTSLSASSDPGHVTANGHTLTPQCGNFRTGTAGVSSGRPSVEWTFNCSTASNF